MKKTILFLSFLALAFTVSAQKKTTTSAIVAFDATTSIDKLPKAENKTVIAALDTKTGSVQLEATVKNFAFSNPMIQDHFNGANWMNSDEFPKFSFSGKILDLSKVNFSSNGTYTVAVEGNLTIRKIAQPITAPATITVKDGIISTTSNFSIKLSDFDISGTPINAGKVAKEPVITVSAEFK